MSKKYIYGGKASNVTPAGGVKGVLIKSGSEFLFRVYLKDGTFTDYKICHDDLSVTIDSDELASFYSDGEHHTLDHSPNVFGLKPANEYDK
jgi:hypothetical protein